MILKSMNLKTKGLMTAVTSRNKSSMTKLKTMTMSVRMTAKTMISLRLLQADNLTNIYKRLFQLKTARKGSPAFIHRVARKKSNRSSGTTNKYQGTRK